MEYGIQFSRHLHRRIAMSSHLLARQLGLRPVERSTTPASGLRLGPVRLNVRDRAVMVDYWTRVIGLEDLGIADGVQRLGVDGDALLEFVEDPDAVTPPAHSTGLFHVALLVPERHHLAATLQRIVAHKTPLSGATDHLVSEAIYLRDPEGNGIELYWDRPRDTWEWSEYGVGMASLALDLPDLLATLGGDVPQATMPSGTRIGHVHLCVRDVEESEHWYRTVLGFDATAVMPTAAFMSVDGYHHDLGMNVWSSAGGPSPALDATGIDYFTMLVDGALLNRITERVEHAGGTVERHGADALVTDPSGIRIRLAAA